MNLRRGAEDAISIGIVRATHGLDGLLKVESYSGEFDHFTRVSQVTLRKSGAELTVQVAEIRQSGKFVLMRVDGIGSVDLAARWVGAEISVPRELAAPKRPGEYYYADLVGCSVLNGRTAVGVVISVVELPHCDALEVDPGTGKPIVIPFQDVYIGEVDLHARTIELRAGWLIE